VWWIAKGTSALIVQKLREATVATIETPAVQEKLKELGYMLVAPERRSLEHLQKFSSRARSRNGGLGSGPLG
jgi:tripartite-type tricarboxylate transporter receptor subunit TctC